MYRLICHLNSWKRIDKQGVRNEHLNNRFFTTVSNVGISIIDRSRFATGVIPTQKRAHHESPIIPRWDSQSVFSLLFSATGGREARIPRSQVPDLIPSRRCFRFSLPCCRTPRKMLGHVNRIGTVRTCGLILEIGRQTGCLQVWNFRKVRK